ncbi:Calpain-type cysteine protease DEK1 [Capsicum chinense]|nr:Calpain-type cysteine protease DEK1 [Capsicum chinense]
MSFSEKHLEDLSKRIEQVLEENQNLRQQLTQLYEEYRVAQDNRDYIQENYQEKVKELKSKTLLTTVQREKLYSKEMDIKQLQADLATTVLKKDENINQLTNDLQECKKELGVVKAILPKVFQERDFMWEEVKSYSEMNMLLNYEINMLKRKSTVIRLREGFRREDQNGSASSSKGCGSSVKRSSSADAGHLGNATVPCTGDVVQEPEVGSSYVDRNLEHNSSLVVCSSSGLESQGGDSSTSTSANQQILDLNLALAFQEKLSDPRITSMLKRKGRHTDRELANLLQDKGLDPNFAVMLKENGLDPMILALLQRSSLDADREHRDSNPPVTDSNDVEDVLPNHISFSEELRLQGLGKWLQRRCRVILHHAAGTPERAWLLFSLIFILETVIVAIFRPKTIKLLNATHQQVRNALVLLKFSLVYLEYGAAKMYSICQGGDSSTSTSANQQILDLNLALAFQEKLSDPRITSMLKRKGRHTDRELANLLQDKGLDPNFAVMLKENGLDPMILALLQRSSLDADREHRDSNPPVTDSNDVEDVLPNHISFSEELRLQGLGKWLQRCRVMLHHVAGTPERAWLLFSLIFILETVVVAIFRPKTIKLLNATHQQFEFGIAVLLLSPVVCSILAFLRSLQAEDLSMTSKPRKVQNRIEQCLRQYMSRKEIVNTLNQDNIEPRFTELVWQKLEEENQEFFQAYYLKLMVKEQIIEFNRLLAEQAKMTQQFSSAIASLPMSNGCNISPIHQNSTCGAAENVGTDAKPNGIMHEPELEHEERETFLNT